MFKTLLIKEIQTAIFDFRFGVVLVLCLSIIPLSFYVSTKNYEQQLADYQQEVKAYKELWTGNIDYSFNGEGVRPPSPLSIFSRGLDEKIPYKVTTSRNGDFVIDYIKPGRKENLLGKMDFTYIVAFVLSILAISFTFSSISGDKENGLLKAVLSNPVLRRKILFSKLIGGYLVFLVPFILSIFIGLTIVHLTGIIPVFSASLLPSILILTTISMIFIFVMFSLGLWISALSKSSILSINVLLLIWIIIGLVIPKLSPIIAEAVYPVESNSIFEINKTMVRNAIMKDRIKDEEILFESLRDKYAQEFRDRTKDWNEVFGEYDKISIPLNEKYNKLLSDEITKLTKDYESRCEKQNSLVKSIDLLSPINSANNLMAEFSATGYSEANNFIQQSQKYQEYIQQTIYDKIPIKHYRTKGSVTTNQFPIGEFDPSTAPVPVLEYQHIDLNKALSQNWGDIVLLFAYSLLFFVLAFVSFLRFDVR